MTHSASRLAPTSEAWEAGPDEVLLGVDVVELVSSAMYVEPLTAYREYIQNSADAIDDARACGALSTSANGRVDIAVDPAARTVRIRDNGIGIPGSEFVRRLTAFGASEKRGRNRRGLRGVGRLAALGYCQELLFRSRTAADEPVRELRWDCRQLRTLLRASDYRGTLSDAVKRTTFQRANRVAGYPHRFFEVELRGVVRHGRDDLLNEAVIRGYLGQVAPVPFSRSFHHSEAIETFIGDALSPTLHIFVNGVGPVQRPHAQAITMGDGIESKATDIALVTIPGADGEAAAKGWVLHHEYRGAIPRALGVRGLRLRSGNIQVGDDATLNEVFTEPRFNAWCIGEIHILDRRLIPNGRRDQYEQNVHFANVVNHLLPISRDIGARCRARSQYRQLLRRAELFAERIDGGLVVVRQGAVSIAARRALLANLEHALGRLEKISKAHSLSLPDRRVLAARHASLRRRLTRASVGKYSAPVLRRLSAERRRAYEQIFSLMYDCASNMRGAKELVDRVLDRLRP